MATYSRTDKYIFRGLGFRLKLKNIPVVEYYFEDVLLIDWNRLVRLGILALKRTKRPLTLSEQRFLRKFYTIL